VARGLGTARDDAQEVIESEVKLRFDSYEAARQAVDTAGGRLVRSSRVQHDRFFDTRDGALRAAASVVRLRREPGVATLTFKGPPLGGPVKSREEIETAVADVDAAETLLHRIGYVEVFRIEKTREDYEIDGTLVVIDRFQGQVFVEIEAAPDRIAAVAAALGRSTADYIVASYRKLSQS
jgi:adenylate cyclase class 2